MIDDFEGTSLDAIRQRVSVGIGIVPKGEFRANDDVTLLEFEDWNEQRDVGLHLV